MCDRLILLLQNCVTASDLLVYPLHYIDIVVDIYWEGVSLIDGDNILLLFKFVVLEILLHILLHRNAYGFSNWGVWYGAGCKIMWGFHWYTIFHCRVNDTLNLVYEVNEWRREIIDKQWAKKVIQAFVLNTEYDWNSTP